MKVNELMQGDLVLYEYNGEKIHARVVEIYRSSALVESVSKEYEPIEIAEDKLFPVDITPEILEKNGFTKDEEIDQWYFKSDYRLDLGLLAVGIDDGCGTGFCVMRNGAITYYCKYVHELQHYLRLIGGAKKIEL